MTKTIKEWYQELPPDIREKALKYAELNLDIKVNSLHEAIYSGFIFNKTEEGDDYWYNITNLKEIELPEILIINGKKYKRI